MQKECPICHGTRKVQSALCVDEFHECTVCHGTGFIDVVEDQQRKLSFPPVVLGFKKRTVEIKTISDLMVLGNYLELRAPKGAGTPVVFEDGSALEAAVWESMDGEMNVEIRKKGAK